MTPSGRSRSSWGEHQRVWQRPALPCTGSIPYFLESFRLDVGHGGVEPLQIRRGWAGTDRESGAIWRRCRYHEITQGPMRLYIRALFDGVFPRWLISRTMATVESEKFGKPSKQEDWLGLFSEALRQARRLEADGEVRSLLGGHTFAMEERRCSVTSSPLTTTRIDPTIRSWGWAMDLTRHAQEAFPHQRPLLIGCKTRSPSGGCRAVIGCRRCNLSCLGQFSVNHGDHSGL